MTRCVGGLIDANDYGHASNLLSTAKAGTTEGMGRKKRTPERSTLVRRTTQAFSRRQSTNHDGEAPGEAGDPDIESSEGSPVEASDVETQPIAVAPAPESARGSSADSPRTAAPTPSELPATQPPAPRDEPWPDATPPPMKPVAAPPTRQRSSTMIMGEDMTFGSPPEMPKSSAPPPLVLGNVENPTHMPGPREVPSGNPEDPASPPGSVPPGDSRSLRRDDDFALVYRIGTCVVSRTGTVGTRGQWRVVEYPTSAAAASSYAKECSRFVSEGFSDYRG